MSYLYFSFCTSSHQKKSEDELSCSEKLQSIELVKIIENCQCCSVKRRCFYKNQQFLPEIEAFILLVYILCFECSYFTFDLGMRLFCVSVSIGFILVHCNFTFLIHFQGDASAIRQTFPEKCTADKTAPCSIESMYLNFKLLK